MAKTNRGLGMGLDALLKMNIQEEVPNTTTNENDVIAGFVELPIDRIMPNPNQPRKSFDEEALDNLMHSIKSFGVIQPITVSKNDDFYEIIAGERRYRAAKLAGLTKIPVIVKDLSQKERLEISLVENIQRENLNPIEEGLAYSSLIETYNITQEELSDRLGKSRTSITNTIRLLNLDPQVQRWIVEGKITPGHARAVLSLDDKKQHISFGSYVIQNNLSVREAEVIVKKWPLLKENNPKTKNTVREIEVQRAEDELAIRLRSKVKIVGTSKKGKIQIEYFNQEELENIIELIEGKR